MVAKVAPRVQLILTQVLSLLRYSTRPPRALQLVKTGVTSSFSGSVPTMEKFAFWFIKVMT